MDEINNINSIETLVGRYGVREVLTHLAKKIQAANNSAIKFAIDSNPTAASMSLTEVKEAIESILMIIREPVNAKEVAALIKETEHTPTEVKHLDAKS